MNGQDSYDQWRRERGVADPGRAFTDAVMHRVRAAGPPAQASRGERVVAWVLAHRAAAAAVIVLGLVAGIVRLVMCGLVVLLAAEGGW